MQYSTIVDIRPVGQTIAPGNAIFTLGSCFAQNIASQLKADKCSVLSNPFGTCYNPTAIVQLLRYTLGLQPLDEALFVEQDGLWLHHHFHSSFRADSKTALHQNIDTTLAQAAEFLKTTKFLCLTLGTAYVYKHLPTGSFVGNCHKLPTANFKKELLHVKGICQDLGTVYQQLLAYNPALQIILTVSPVRHIADGLSQNQLSKSILRAACHYLESDFEHITYFPAYEIMVDQLRDYRWYAADLIHPNQQAQDIIYEQFTEVYFSENLKNILIPWRKLRQDLQHRAFNPSGAAHQKFLKNLKLKLGQLSSQIDVSTELAQIQTQIISP
jgi:hypothetical protein